MALSASWGHPMAITSNKLLAPNSVSQICFWDDPNKTARLSEVETHVWLQLLRDKGCYKPFFADMHYPYVMGLHKQRPKKTVLFDFFKKWKALWLVRKKPQHFLIYPYIYKAYFGKAGTEVHIFGWINRNCTADKNDIWETRMENE